MNLEQQQRLFDACLDVPSEEEREQLLESHPDPAVREAVRELLRAHAEAPDSLCGVFDAPEFPRIAAPHQVGPYRILERLGEGAMGDVFLAEQRTPVRRRVALKILKFGLATSEVLARFELERQTLALLTHENIARIFDAGTTEDGRPYFAMEHVPGVPITHYCDERRLDIPARLALCVQVCAGVQHAHLRGVIHRDLKPSNILVAEIDGAPIPKIIDFGIAKATTASVGASEVYTRFGHVLGTPEYMSPEQAQLSPLEIDARTDVYSLGVVLYQMLTGERPYSVTSDAVDPTLILNEIVTREAKRPSEMAAERTSDSAARAEQRGATPATLAAQLRGDLDWIILKTIEKNRQRRYDSAAALAADLHRHANDEPVLAGPPSTSYRLGKFVRRHRLAVGALGAVFFAVIMFGSAMAWFAREASLERDRANQEAEVAQRVTAFTAGLFELANPVSTGSNEVSARELLDAGVRRLRINAGTQRPDVRAALLEAAGNAYRGLGAYSESESLLREALAIREQSRSELPLAYSQTLLGLALAKREQGDFAAAVTLARNAIEVLEHMTPIDADALTRARIELAELLRRRMELDEAASLAKLALAESQPGTEHVRATMVLGRIRSAQGELEEAEKLLRQAYELQLTLEGPLAELTFETKNGLAETLITRGQSERAEPLLRELVEAARQVYGEEHSEVGVALNNLANAISDMPEKRAEAASVYLNAIDILSKAKGPKHPEVGNTYSNLGALYIATQQWSAADEVFKQAIEIRSVALGPQHPETAGSQHGRGLALLRLGRFRDAQALLEQSVATYTAALGADHWRTANSRMFLGFVHAKTGDVESAQQEMKQSYTLLVSSLGEEHWRAAGARKLMAEAAISTD